MTENINYYTNGFMNLSEKEQISKIDLFYTIDRSFKDAFKTKNGYFKLAFYICGINLTSDEDYINPKKINPKVIIYAIKKENIYRNSKIKYGGYNFYDKLQSVEFIEVYRYLINECHIDLMDKFLLLELEHTKLNTDLDVILSYINDFENKSTNEQINIIDIFYKNKMQGEVIKTILGDFRLGYFLCGINFFPNINIKNINLNKLIIDSNKIDQNVIIHALKYEVQYKITNLIYNNNTYFINEKLIVKDFIDVHIFLIDSNAEIGYATDYFKIYPSVILNKLIDKNYIKNDILNKAINYIENLDFNLETFTKLLDLTSYISKDKTEFKWNLMHYICYEIELFEKLNIIPELFELLRKKGFDFNSLTEENWSPLHILMITEKKNIGKNILIFDYGVNLDVMIKNDIFFQKVNYDYEIRTIGNPGKSQLEVITGTHKVDYLERDKIEISETFKNYNPINLLFSNKIHKNKILLHDSNYTKIFDYLINNPNYYSIINFNNINFVDYFIKNMIRLKIVNFDYFEWIKNSVLIQNFVEIIKNNFSTFEYFLIYLKETIYNNYLEIINIDEKLLNLCLINFEFRSCKYNNITKFFDIDVKAKESIIQLEWIYNQIDSNNGILNENNILIINKLILLKNKQVSLSLLDYILNKYNNMNNINEIQEYDLLTKIIDSTNLINDILKIDLSTINSVLDILDKNINYIKKIINILIDLMNKKNIQKTLINKITTNIIDKYHGILDKQIYIKLFNNLPSNIVEYIKISFIKYKLFEEDDLLLILENRIKNKNYDSHHYIIAIFYLFQNIVNLSPKIIECMKYIFKVKLSFIFFDSSLITNIKPFVENSIIDNGYIYFGVNKRNLLIIPSNYELNTYTINYYLDLAVKKIIPIENLSHFLIIQYINKFNCENKLLNIIGNKTVLDKIFGSYEFYRGYNYNPEKRKEIYEYTIKNIKNINLFLDNRYIFNTYIKK